MASGYLWREGEWFLVGKEVVTRSWSKQRCDARSMSQSLAPRMAQLQHDGAILRRTLQESLRQAASRPCELARCNATSINPEPPTSKRLEQQLSMQDGPFAELLNSIH